MDLELLKKFAVVAEEGSLTAAAKRLNTSQSALSRAMDLFEYRLKTDLFVRHPRGVDLTTQGERLFEHAKKIILENEIFLKSFLEDENKISGDLNIVAFPYLGAEWLIPNLEGFLELYPEINIRIHLDPENVNPINFDVGIGSFIPNQPQLTQKELFPDYNQFFATEKYLNKYGIPLIPEDLDSHRLITYKDQETYTSHRSINLLFNTGKTPYSAPRKPYFVVDSLSGMLNAALQGYGIAELPTLSVTSHPELKIVLPKIKGKNLPVYFIFQTNRKNSKKIKTLYQYLVKKSEEEIKNK